MNGEKEEKKLVCWIKKARLMAEVVEIQFNNKRVWVKPLDLPDKLYLKFDEIEFYQKVDLLKD